VSDGFLCSTGDPCSRSDQCQNGVCKGTFVCVCATDAQCDDGNACTVDKVGSMCARVSCTRFARAQCLVVTNGTTYCDHQPGNAGSVCRAAQGACDVAEVRVRARLRSSSSHV
jgi:hypothetical protein